MDETFPDLGGACQVGVGACMAAGALACNATADGLECDGEPGLPQAELCDEIDNDCDGQTDEGACDVCTEGTPCESDMPGVCRAGVTACEADELVCRPAPASEEICNGLDDDCDGQIDEGDAAQDVICYDGPEGTDGTGECVFGIQACNDGALGACEGQVTPVDEICNALDDDCDGAVDEDVCLQLCDPDEEIDCYAGPPETVGIGMCQAGTQVCSADGSAFGPCEGQVLPADEICDQFDNDCNDMVDDLPEGGVCPSCMDEVDCPAGQLCVDGLCQLPVIVLEPDPDAPVVPIDVALNDIVLPAGLAQRFELTLCPEGLLAWEATLAEGVPAVRVVSEAPMGYVAIDEEAEAATLRTRGRNPGAEPQRVTVEVTAPADTTANISAGLLCPRDRFEDDDLIDDAHFVDDLDEDDRLLQGSDADVMAVEICDGGTVTATIDQVRAPSPRFAGLETIELVANGPGIGQRAEIDVDAVGGVTVTQPAGGGPGQWFFTLTAAEAPDAEFDVLSYRINFAVNCPVCEAGGALPPENQPREALVVMARPFSPFVCTYDACGQPIQPDDMPFPPIALDRNGSADPPRPGNGLSGPWAVRVPMLAPGMDQVLSGHVNGNDLAPGRLCDPDLASLDVPLTVPEYGGGDAESLLVLGGWTRVNDAVPAQCGANFDAPCPADQAFGVHAFDDAGCDAEPGRLQVRVINGAFGSGAVRATRRVATGLQTFDEFAFPQPPVAFGEATAWADLPVNAGRVVGSSVALMRADEGGQTELAVIRLATSQASPEQATAFDLPTGACISVVVTNGARAGEFGAAFVVQKPRICGRWRRASDPAPVCEE